jgi:hemerythrin
MEFPRAEFTPNLIIGITAIDKQHAEYMVRLNKLIEKCEKGINQTEILDALYFLQSYAANHFEAEEYLMMGKNYPEFDKQREMHGYFIDKLFQLSEELKTDKGFNFENLEKLYKLAYFWFVDHITKEDAKIAKYIHSM